MTLYTKFPLMKHLYADIIHNLSMQDSGMKKNKKAQKNKKNRNTYYYTQRTWKSPWELT